jgi:putative ABC transport system permease protein
VLRQTVRSAYRSLRKSPGYSLLAVASLGIGIGGSFSVFTLFHGIVLKPLSYPDPERLVLVTQWNSGGRPSGHLFPSGIGVIAIEFLRWRDKARSFDSIAAARSATVTYTGASYPEILGVLKISPEFFDTLGVKPQLGRWFTRKEESRGMADVAILSDSLWRRSFAADPKIIGQKILLDGSPHEIVGVTPPEMRLFHGRQLHRAIEMPERTDLFLPLRFTVREEQGYVDPVYAVIARLKAGASISQARSELDSSLATIQFLGDPLVELHTVVTPLHTALIGDVKKGLLLLLVAVGLVLGIACVNVANLSLVRATKAGRELALRTALGASRADLVAYSIAQSLLLSLAATALGAFVSIWLTDFLIYCAPSQVPRLDEAVPDRSLFLFALAVCAGTTILLGLLPALKYSAVAPQLVLNTASRGNTDGRWGGRLRAGLVGAEVVLGTVLLILSALLLTSLHRILNVPRGFQTDDVVVAEVSLPTPEYQSPERQSQFCRAVLDRVVTLPGVLHAGAISTVPLGFERHYAPVIVENSDRRGEEMATWSRVSADYFSTLRIQPLSGRLFRDGGEPDLVAVISESTARALWPDQNPLGRRIAHLNTPEAFYRVVGVVPDVRAEGLDQPPSRTIYRLFWQRPDTQFSIVIQTRLAPKFLSRAVREAVWSVDSAIPVPEVHALSSNVDKSVEQRRFQALLLSVFAGIAVLLAALGIYGVVAYAVLQRRKEFGVRIVLGADHREIRRLVFTHGMAPVIIGLGIGALIAMSVARWIGSLLFQVNALDPGSFLKASLLLALTAALPCWLSARQAGRTDPVEALRLD